MAMVKVIVLLVRRLYQSGEGVYKKILKEITFRA